MDLASVDLNLLVAFDLLIEEESVRGAARRANVTPSAMSHTLARLRDLLGDELLVRAGRGMAATPRAQELAVPVKDLLARAREVLDSPATFVARELQRRFRVACTDHISTVLLGPAEERLMLEAPGVDLSVLPVVTDTMEQLRKGDIDVAIGVFPGAPQEVRRRRLFTDRFVTVHRAGHPRLASQNDQLELEQFVSEPHVLVAPRGTPEGLVDRKLHAMGLERRVVRAFPSFLAALWHVTQTDALLTVSARLVSAMADALPLVEREPPLELPDYDLEMAWHPRTQKVASDEWFRGLLVATAEALPLLREGHEGRAGVRRT
jgi:DNA-binding transcriptional LysR family regulator